MSDPDEGSLYLDVAVTYQQHNADGKPQTGMWKAQFLKATQEVCGFRQGEIHPTNMMGPYGSIKTTMGGGGRQEDTGIISRIMYIQGYEPFRKQDNSRKMVPLKSAYLHDDAFVKTVNQLKAVCRASKKSSFGVRDEIRVAASALGQLGECIDRIVRPYLLFYVLLTQSVGAAHDSVRRYYIHTLGCFLFSVGAKNRCNSTCAREAFRDSTR